MTQTQTLSEFQAARRDQRAEALGKYRELVGRLVTGEADKAMLDAADELLRPLGLTDEDMAADVALMREHHTCQQELATFEAEKPGIDKKIDELTQAIARLREQMQNADHRLGELQGKRHVAGSPYNKARHRESRIAEIQQKNPRLFGPL